MTEQDEAVRLLRERVLAYVHPHRVGELMALVDALATPPPVPAALDVERIDKYLHDEGVWTGDNEEDWHRAVCEGIARLLHQSEDADED